MPVFAAGAPIVTESRRYLRFCFICLVLLLLCKDNCCVLSRISLTMYLSRILL